MTDKIRIVLADDHEIVREGIKLLINSQADMEVVGEASDGEAAIKQVLEILPDIIIMDISMPKLNGLKTTKKLKKLCPQVKILTLTRHTDTGYLQQLIEAGVNGYILKQSAPTELIGALRAVKAGNNYLAATVTKRVMSGFAASSGTQHLRGELKAEISSRESEVLRLIAWGYSNKEIAEKMSISVKTVEAHKANALRKLDMRSRIDIVRYAILQGWMQET